MFYSLQEMLDLVNAYMPADEVDRQIALHRQRHMPQFIELDDETAKMLENQMRIKVTVTTTH